MLPQVLGLRRPFKTFGHKYGTFGRQCCTSQHKFGATGRQCINCKAPTLRFREGPLYHTCVSLARLITKCSILYLCYRFWHKLGMSRRQCCIFWCQCSTFGREMALIEHVRTYSIPLLQIFMSVLNFWTQMWHLCTPVESLIAFQIHCYFAILCLKCLEEFDV